MRAITLKQPWATAVVHMGKDVENRSRNLAGSYRGPVAIHAGRTIDHGAVDNFTLRRAWHLAGMPQRPMPDAPGLFEPILRETPDEDAEWLPLGAVIGVVDLVDVHTDGVCYDRDIQRLARLYRTAPDEFTALPDNGSGGLIGRARLCSQWAQGDGYHLILTNPRPLAEPIPYRGALGLWTLPDDVLAGAL